MTANWWHTASAPAHTWSYLSDRIDTLKVAGCDLGQDVEHSGLARGTRGTATATAPRRIVLGDEDEDEDEYITQPNEVSELVHPSFGHY